MKWYISGGPLSPCTVLQTLQWRFHGWLYSVISPLKPARSKAKGGDFFGGLWGRVKFRKGITVSGKMGSKYTWPQPEVKWTCASGCKSRRININCKHVWVIIKHGLLDNSPSSRSIVFSANQTSIYSCFFHVFFHMFLWFYFFLGG